MGESKIFNAFSFRIYPQFMIYKVVITQSTCAISTALSSNVHSVCCDNCSVFFSHMFEMIFYVMFHSAACNHKHWNRFRGIGFVANWYHYLTKTLENLNVLCKINATRLLNPQSISTFQIFTSPFLHLNRIMGFSLLSTFDTHLQLINITQYLLHLAPFSFCFQSTFNLNSP